MRLAGHLRRFLRFVALSGVSAGITIVLPLALHYGLGVPERYAVAISLGVALVVNFLGLRALVFHSGGSYGGQAVRFVLATLVTRGLEYATVNALLSLEVAFPVALLVTQSIFTVLKYLTYGRMVFSPRPEQTESADAGRRSR